MNRLTARMIFVAIIAAFGILVCVIMLEAERAGLDISYHQVDETPVEIWRLSDQATGPLVVVAHGYAGSMQMMQPITIALARAGFVVAAFDFHGHGRSMRPMMGDITSLDGTTALLVTQTKAVADALRARSDVSGPTSLLGHSMATDVVIRAAARIEDVGAVVAISMYSDAVTPSFPEKLLIISGEWEARLRNVAMDKILQIDPNAVEGETLREDSILRRAAAAPNVGHVGVLYSKTTLVEARDWIADATEQPRLGTVPQISPWLIGLLGSIVALAWPLSGLLGPPQTGDGPKRQVALAANALPVLPALAVAYMIPKGALGLLAFGTLAAFFACWGIVQLVILWRSGWRPERLSGVGLGLLLIWGLILFAPALDRYGAAFMPLGPRLPVMALLLLGTVPFCIAGSVITRGSDWLIWLVTRLLPIIALFIVMLIIPQTGVAFTVLPVMILFWAVYGLAGRWIMVRTGAMTSGLGLGIILAWAIAASTPLIAV